MFNLTALADMFFCSANVGETWVHMASIFSGETISMLVKADVTNFALGIFFSALLFIVDWQLYSRKDATIEGLVSKLPLIHSRF